MIVKVQISIAQSQDGQQMYLAYNEERTKMYHGFVTQEVETKMGRRYKAYFDAEVRDEQLVLGDEVDWQKW